MLFASVCVLLAIFIRPYNICDVNISIELWALQPGPADLYHELTLTAVRPALGLFNVKSPHQMAGQCGAFFRPRQHRLKSACLVALLLLPSGIETNPGHITNTNTLQSNRGHYRIDMLSRPERLISDWFDQWSKSRCSRRPWNQNNTRWSNSNHAWLCTERIWRSSSTPTWCHEAFPWWWLCFI